MSKKSHAADTQALRQDVRKHLEMGAVTPDYQADRTAVLKQLNQALATELVCVLRYRRHFFTARGIQARAVAPEFLAHSNQELAHADGLAARIVQLGGEPDFAPQHLEGCSHSEYVVCDNLMEMVRENLVAERVAVHTYRELIQQLGDKDPTTSELLRGILAVEEEHAEELATMLGDMPHSGVPQDGKG